MGTFDDLMSDSEKVEKVKIDKPKNHVAFVMDHSGSMGVISEQSRTNFNEQLQQIKKDYGNQDNYITIIEFADEVKEVCSEENIDNVKELEKYWIGGLTALYDAIARAIVRVEEKILYKDNHAALVVIITDGYENHSKEYGGEKGRLRLKKKIEKLQETGRWTFVFMGAEQNVLETAVDNLGIYNGNTMMYTSDVNGVTFAYKALSGITGPSGSCGSSGTSGYTEWFGSRTKGVINTTSFFHHKDEANGSINEDEN